MAASDEVVAREGGSSDPGARRRVAAALVEKADALVDLRRSAEALPCAEEALALFDAGAEQTASAMRIQAISLLRLTRLEESVAAADRLIERFDGDQPAEVRRRIAGASMAKIAALSKAGRHVEAEAAADQLIEGFAADPVHGPQRANAIVTGLLLKVLAVRDQGRLDAAVDVADELVRRFGGSPQTSVRVVVARGWNDKADTLIRLVRFDQALEVQRSVVARLGAEDDRKLRGQAAAALFGQSVALRRSGRTAEAVAIYDELLARPRAGRLADEVVALGDVRGPAGGIRVRRGGGGEVAAELVQVAANGVPAVPLAEHLAQPVGLAQPGGGAHDVADRDRATEHRGGVLEHRVVGEGDEVVIPSRGSAASRSPRRWPRRRAGRRWRPRPGSGRGVAPSPWPAPTAGRARPRRSLGCPTGGGPAGRA
jgi:tetratricopeptide (TPR) repeat protein